jgi:hypothetical protein
MPELILQSDVSGRIVIVSFYDSLRRILIRSAV